ncbi:MAG: alpha/beta hydrolase [Microbacteriaceae bacterium]|nr:alpha/beta hydrolase [Microbacteriaceae bacterium]
MTTSQTTAAVRFLDRPEGRLAYTVTGDGPLIVAVPGMGDLRGTWRELTGPLVDAGFRVAVLDLRGHGDADTTFAEHGDVATASDIVALIDELGGPALVIGNSMAGSAAVIAAGERPDAVAGLVLISPFLRGGSGGAGMRLFFRLLFARPWGAAVWAAYYRGPLNTGAKSPWLGEHAAAIRASLREPGRLRSLRDLAVALDHDQVTPHVPAVVAPVLIAVGANDPDYQDPAVELAWMGEQLHAETLLVPDAAHYAHHQRPDVVLPAVLRFAGSLRENRGWRRA